MSKPTVVVTLKKKHLFAYLMSLWLYASWLPAAFVGMGGGLVLQEMGLISPWGKRAGLGWALLAFLGTLLLAGLYLYATWRMRRVAIFLVKAILHLLAALGLFVCWLTCRHRLVTALLLVAIAFGVLAERGHRGYDEERYVNGTILLREYGWPRWLQQVLPAKPQGQARWPLKWRFHALLFLANVGIAGAVGAATFLTMSVVVIATLKRLRIDDVGNSIFTTLKRVEVVAYEEPSVERNATPPQSCA